MNDAAQNVRRRVVRHAGSFTFQTAIRTAFEISKVRHYATNFSEFFIKNINDIRRSLLHILIWKLRDPHESNVSHVGRMASEFKTVCVNDVQRVFSSLNHRRWGVFSTVSSWSFLLKFKTAKSDLDSTVKVQRIDDQF